MGGIGWLDGHSIGVNGGRPPTTSRSAASSVLRCRQAQLSPLQKIMQRSNTYKSKLSFIGILLWQKVEGDSSRVNRSGGISIVTFHSADPSAIADLVPAKPNYQQL